MQTIRIKLPSSGAPRLLAGAAVLTGGAALVAGLVLVLSDAHSPLRGPLALFYLLAAPGAVFAAALRGLDPWVRGVLSLTGAVTVVMLVAQGMLATRHWSVEGGVIAVGALSALAFMCRYAYRPRQRP
ncbi:hypothetical protein [Streptomyces sp. NPDC016845]|uniref:hypothetical protein n=1 Tax=Streptomyces sp. NPDC016845 TaxID=3364972 RepID=UPI0037BC56C9